MIAIVLLGAMAAACSGAAPKVKSGASSGKRTFAPVEVPASVKFGERERLEQVLFLLPADHPDRLGLRDVLAKAYADEFASVDEKDLERRTEIFKEGMRLHAPGDFEPGKVAAPLLDAALWMADRMEARGNEAVVLASLAFAQLARPEEPTYSERYMEISEWSESVRDTIEDKLERYMSVCGLYLDVVRLVPRRDIVDHLAELLIRRQEAMIETFEQLERFGGGVSGFLYQMAMQKDGIGRDVVYIYFLTGDTTAALDKLQGDWTETGMAADYIALLEDLKDGDDLGGSMFTLAGALASQDPMAGMRACAAAREKDPKDPRYPICVGNAFAIIGRPRSAVDFFVEATRVAPEEDVYAAVMDLIQVSLFELHRMEREDLSREAIQVAEEIIEQAMSLEDLDPDLVPGSAAALLHTAGVIGFDNGWIGEAERQFERAYEIQPGMIGSLDKLVEIKQAAGRHREALEILDRVLSEPGDKLQSFWRATLLEKRGDSLRILGDDARAQVDYEAALDAWRTGDIPSELGPLAALRRGVILDRLGDRAGSNEAFRKSIRLDPERRATYANLISFLVVRERLDDAKEFYRIAYNQDRIDNMWKIYFSLWVEGLAMRTDDKSFELARGYLAQSDGTSWQDDIARFFAKKITLDELAKRADNPGQKVETDFYGAVVLLSEGKKDQAHRLLKKVVDSNLMGFFEFVMAKSILDGEKGGK